jgi:hypothetical protein
VQLQILKGEAKTGRTAPQLGSLADQAALAGYMPLAREFELRGAAAAREEGIAIFPFRMRALLYGFGLVSTVSNQGRVTLNFDVPRAPSPESRFYSEAEALVEEFSGKEDVGSLEGKLARWYLEQGRYGKAAARFKGMVSRRASDSGAWVGLATATLPLEGDRAQYEVFRKAVAVLGPRALMEDPMRREIQFVERRLHIPPADSLLVSGARPRAGKPIEAPVENPSRREFPIEKAAGVASAIIVGGVLWALRRRRTP